MIFEVAEGFPGNMKKKKKIIIFGSSTSKGPIPSSEPSYLSYTSSNFFFLVVDFE